MMSQEEKQQQQQPAELPASLPTDLEFLNEPATGSAAADTLPPPPPLAATTFTSSPTATQTGSIITTTTSSAYGDNGGLPTGIIVSPAPGDLNGGGGSESIEELPNGDVIVVFEDQPPQAGEPMINNASFIGTILLILLTMAWPFMVSHDSRGIDVLAFAVTLPACGAFFWVMKSPTERQFAHPINIWLKFFAGWAIMLPVAWLGALGCIFFGILFVAILLGITGASSSVAFAAISIMFVCAVIVPEEFVKLLAAQRDNVRKNIQNPRQYVLYSVFSSLGMATFEAYIMVHYVRRVLDYGARREAGEYDASSTPSPNVGVGKSGDSYTPTTHAPSSVSGAVHQMLAQAMTSAPTSTRSVHTPAAAATTPVTATSPDLVDGGDFIWMFVLCLVCIIPMHVLSGYHVGLGIARRDIMNVKTSMVGIIVIPAVFRSVFLYIVLFLPYVTKWDQAGLLALLLIPLYVVLVKWDEKKMPRSYLLRSGYLTAFGYGALPEEDEATQGQDMQEDQQGHQNGRTNEV